MAVNLVNESSWSLCNDIPTMLQYLCEADAVTIQQLCLFRAAVARCLLPQPAQPALVNLIDSIEQFADGLIDDVQLHVAHELSRQPLNAAREDWHELSVEMQMHPRESYVYTLLSPYYEEAQELYGRTYAVFHSNFTVWDHMDLAWHTRNTISTVRHCYRNASADMHLRRHGRGRAIRAVRGGMSIHDAAAFIEEQHYCRILRCIAGNPFQFQSVPKCMITPEVLALSESIARANHFERVQELAEILPFDDADDSHAIDHTLDDVHVKGCWVIESILRK